MAPSDSDPAFDATIGGDTLVSSLPAPPTAPRRQRATLSGYQLGAVLGRGGMGEVTLWRDDRLGREVAVKTLLPAAVADDEVLICCAVPAARDGSEINRIQLAL